jgi:ferredoxin-nitrite reductase
VIGACGDVTRNVVGCTVSGLAHDEILDGYATSEAIHEFMLGNKAYSNLPRKFKISVTGCAEDCARGLINDIALSAAIADDGTRGFNVRVGGGLSSSPHFARWLDVFVTPEEAPEVVAGVTAIFRDAEENRKARGKARIKFLVDRVGPEALREELERRVGRRCAPASARRRAERRGPHRDQPPARRRARHRRARRARRAAARGASSPASPPRPALRLAGRRRPPPHAPAERPCSRGMPEARVDALLDEPLVAELTPSPTLFNRGLQTCTGKEFCGWRRSTPRSARSRSPRSSTSTCGPTATATTCACTSPAARRPARSTRSPTSASRRAQEGRRAVRRGDGHPHRRPARREPKFGTSSSARSRTGISTRRC